MPGRPSCWYLVCLAGMAAQLSACDGWSSSAADDVAEESLVEELPVARSPATGDVLTVSTTASAGSHPVQPSRTYVRTIAQSLHQSGRDGSADVHSSLELTLAVAPEVAQTGFPPGTATLGPLYRLHVTRVRLLQDIPGDQPVSWDSDVVMSEVPPAAFLYRALPGSTLAFRLTPEGRLGEVIGFEQLVGRCLDTAAAEKRSSIRAALPISSPADGLAWIFDDSLGLLPAGSLQPGQHWTIDRRTAGLVPLTITTRYTLLQVSADAAEIDFTGTVSAASGRLLAESGESRPGVSAGESGSEWPGHQPAEFFVRAGQIAGRCRLDRRSGLPASCRSEQTLDLAVRLGDGGEFQQSRTTVTTLLPQDAAIAAAIHFPQASPVAAGGPRR
ncbi:MAG: DUF6263 family protein [Planctomycetaceae bacterium]